jgi:hypothetical protein
VKVKSSKEDQPTRCCHGIGSTESAKWKERWAAQKQQMSVEQHRNSKRKEILAARHKQKEGDLHLGRHCKNKREDFRAARHKQKGGFSGGPETTKAKRSKQQKQQGGREVGSINAAQGKRVGRHCICEEMLQRVTGRTRASSTLRHTSPLI